MLPLFIDKTHSQFLTPFCRTSKKSSNTAEHKWSCHSFKIKLYGFTMGRPWLCYILCCIMLLHAALLCLKEYSQVSHSWDYVCNVNWDYEMWNVGVWRCLWIKLSVWKTISLLPLFMTPSTTQCSNLISKECLLFVCAVYVSTLLCLPWKKTVHSFKFRAAFYTMKYLGSGLARLQACVWVQ